MTEAPLVVQCRRENPARFRAAFWLGVPPLKWSTNWGSFAPQIGGPGDDWEAREARRYRHETAAG
jgi:hypothetical protein